MKKITQNSAFGITELLSSLTIEPSYYGNLQLISGLDQLPHLEVPYPLTN